MKKDEAVVTHGGKHVDVDALRGNVPSGWTEEDWRAHVDKLARAVEHVPIANAKDPEHVLWLNEWPFDVCMPGQVVRFQVHNRGPLPLQFRGILWGVAGSW